MNNEIGEEISEDQVFDFIKNSPPFDRWLFADYRNRITKEWCTTLLLADNKGQPRGHLTLNKDQVIGLIKQLNDFLALSKQDEQ